MTLKFSAIRELLCELCYWHEAHVRAPRAVAGFAIATPILIAPASAQVAIDIPIGGVRVGPQPRYYRDYDRPAYRAYGYDRGYRGCRTVTIERDDGSVRRVRRCD